MSNLPNKNYGCGEKDVSHTNELVCDDDFLSEFFFLLLSFGSVSVMLERKMNL